MSYATRRLLLRFSERFMFLQKTRSLCTNNNNIPKPTSISSTNPTKRNDIVSGERYKQLENLDMVTAAKILFNDDPPKKKKFGFDFHLVQFFFACLPSFAVYLVAQYARYDIKKMEVDVAQKKKKRDEEEAKSREKEEEAKAKEREKEMELNPLEEEEAKEKEREKEAKSNPQLSEVKARLNKLEEAVKEIVVLSKNQVNDAEKKPSSSSVPSDTKNSSASNKVVEEDGFHKHHFPKPKPELGDERKHSIAPPNSSQDSKDQHQGGGGAS
ncbi:PREDICTED: splicing regulatory glutamine/lysine-rich protein 1-like [Lupinus angustifolius]|uniref:splicing regulatory glutamine/lysine-rich protein 1-like n=1 Tax=Lupinus angustifolius TaxID=3871 RepID=UPI00092F90AB|nr:PREDICTED: splicing regulatory glutamine/lysine-rich protein 1-like [Lupinus angustifolius]